jgi:multiple antibiotic resistance protein
MGEHIGQNRILKNHFEKSGIQGVCVSLGQSCLGRSCLLFLNYCTICRGRLPRQAAALVYPDPVLWTNPATVALNEFRAEPIVRFSVLALSSIFFLVDPFAAIGSFLAITAGADRARRRRMARKGALTCFIVLTSFALAGQLIFRMFGITLPAFEVAGGLILLLIGLDMLEARRSPTQETTGETEEAAAKEDAGIVPLGVPMLAGPGAISSVMVLVGQVPAIWHWEMGAILGSIAITAFTSYLVLAGADHVRQVLGETGIRILVRIMGLLLVALAMQFFVNGLTDLGIIPRHG